MLLGKMGAKSGEKPGENAAQQEKGQIDKNTCHLSDKKGDSQLSQIVEDAAQNAGEKEVVTMQKAVRSQHDAEAQQTACKAVQQTQCLTEEKGGKENAHQKHQQGIGWFVIAQYQQGNDVGKSKLDTGNRNKRRYHAFYGEYD